MKLVVGKKYGLIPDVMENVFGFRYAGRQAYAKVYYIVDGSKKGEEMYGAWFPKIGKGKTWVNTITSDGRFIYMNSNDQSAMNKDESEAIHFTFIRDINDKGPYMYAGAFVRTYRDLEKGWIYKRVETDINLDNYPIIPKKTKHK